MIFSWAGVEIKWDWGTGVYASYVDLAGRLTFF